MRSGPRAIVIAAITHPHTGALFVAETRWDRTPIFHRPPGGGIEFGETAAEALRREMREEFDAQIEVGPRIAVLENIFDIAGEPGHEIVIVLRAAFLDQRFLVDVEYPVLDSAVDFGLWRPCDLPHSVVPLYPDGMPEVLGLPL